jgi:hypothetical protein
MKVISGASLLVLVLSTGACFPAVTHGPRVESGLTAGATLGGTAGSPRYTVGDAGGIRLRNAVKGAYLGYGRAASTPRSLGAFAAVSVPAMQLDTYLQLPASRTGAFVGGFGVVAGPNSVMPYLQAGQVTAEGHGWWTSLGYGRYAPDDLSLCPSRAWTGTAAIQQAHGPFRTQFYLQGATGRIPGPRRPDPPSCAPGETGQALALGVSLGWQFRRGSTPGEP